jgi:DNA-binding winged helix-turn-helix (wHTH) protein
MPEEPPGISVAEVQPIAIHLQRLVAMADDVDVATDGAPAIDELGREAVIHDLDRALLDLARAALAVRQARARLEANQQSAPTRQTAVATRDAPDAAAPPLVIDAVLHEITDGSVRVTLASRVIPRRLLYALLSADGHVLDRNAICHALWHTDYTLRQDSAVKSNIRRLRGLLEGTRLAIRADEDGYRLSIPPGSVIVPPHRS